MDVLGGPSGWRRVRRGVRAEVLVLQRDKLVLGALLTALVYQTYSLRQSVAWQPEAVSPGYFTFQSLTSLAQATWMALPVVMASIGAREEEWNTSTERVVMGGRGPVMLAKLVSVALVTTGAVVLCAGLGLVLDFVGHGGGPSPGGLLAGCLVVFLALLFWSLLALLVSFAARSFLLGALAVIGIYLVGAITGAGMPAALAQVLPIDNLRAMLWGVITTGGGFVEILPPHASGFVQGCVYSGVGLVVMTGSVWAVSMRRSY